MAAPHLTALRSPAFPQVLNQAVRRDLALVDRLLQESELVTCYWSDEHLSDCRSLATIHHLESGLEFCPRHFALTKVIL